MRSILTNSEEKVVALAENLETLDSYMQLENLRLDYPFTYQIDIDPAIDPNKTKIPPLLLQPFVENSIWHGLVPRRKPGGEIIIRIRQVNDTLLCTVTDNGIGRQKSIEIRPVRPERKSHGIRITKDRIDIINQQQQTNGYVTLSDLNQGTEVAVGLPLLIA